HMEYMTHHLCCRGQRRHLGWPEPRSEDMTSARSEGGSRIDKATVHIRRADDRAKTKISWLDSKHSFSFGDHYDPGNTHHGLLLVNNDDIVKPGTGFHTHPTLDLEIIQWVLQGSP